MVCFHSTVFAYVPVIYPELQKQTFLSPKTMNYISLGSYEFIHCVDFKGNIGLNDRHESADWTVGHHKTRD